MKVSAMRTGARKRYSRVALENRWEGRKPEVGRPWLRSLGGYHRPNSATIKVGKWNRSIRSDLRARTTGTDDGNGPQAPDARARMTGTDHKRRMHEHG
jgi:hypothetical protein